MNEPIIGFSGRVDRPPNERKNHIRYDFELESVISAKDSIISTEGTIHLYIRKDSSRADLSYGDRLIVFGRFHPIPGPDNPDEFDYKRYLKKHRIYAHAFVENQDIKVKTNDPNNSFLSFTYLLRAYAASTIDKHVHEPRENGIAKALLLGIKDYLDNDVKKAYSAAGAMHVLAVSGLHVGIVFMIVQILFGKLSLMGIWGKYSFGMISILTIWTYACLTGLSPSVLRAATMFSFISLGQFSSNQGNIYNTLGFSAFVLLLIDPNLVYSVGFQLSYAAVLGIVYIQPLLYRTISTKYWLLDKAWAITCVSIAAQLATFPLSAYYFHQFPTYFLASNLIVIPAAFLLLVVGIGMIVLEPIISLAGEYLGYLLNVLIWFLNELISLVHHLPNSLIDWIHLDSVGLVLTYLAVLAFISSLHFRSFKTLLVSAFIFISFLGWNILSHKEQYERKELIFYEISNKTAIDLINGHSSRLYLDNYNPDELELLSFQINPHRLASKLDPISKSIELMHIEELHDLALTRIGNKRFIIFDTTTYHLNILKKIETDFVIIHNQSVKSLEWLSEKFNFEHVIISNQNSYYYAQRLKRQADNLNLNLHVMKEDGAFRYRLDEETKKERTPLPALFTTNPD